jgi:elongation factor P
LIDVSSLRKGMHIVLDGKIYTVVDFEMHKMGRGHSAVVRTRIKDVLSALVQDKTFKSGDQVEEAVLTLKNAQYLYKDDNFAYFMLTDNYEQYSLQLGDIEDNIKFMKENMEMNLLFHDNDVIGVLLPASVILEVVETDPGFKGDTVAGSGKPAILETGLKITIPFFVNKGEKVKIDTRTGDYIERA